MIGAHRDRAIRKRTDLLHERDSECRVGENNLRELWGQLVKLENIFYNTGEFYPYF